MFCPSCGTHVEDTAAVCGNCGSALHSFTASAPVQGEAVPVPPQPVPAEDAPHKKKPSGLIIGICAGAAVLVIALILLLTLNSDPGDVISKAFTNSLSAYTDARDRLPLQALEDLRSSCALDAQITLETPDALLLPGIPAGVGVEMQGAYRLEDRYLDAVVTPYFGSMHILSLEAALRDTTLQIREQTLLGEDFYTFDTLSLGSQLAKLKLLDSDAEDLGFDFFALMEGLQPTQEQKQAIEDAAKALTGSTVIVDDRETLPMNINGTYLECRKYTVLIPQQALVQFWEAAAPQFPDLGTEVVDAVKDSLESISDPTLDIYICNSYIHALTLNNLTTGGEEAAVSLYLGGGEQYVDDLTLVLQGAEGTVTLSSTGDHSGRAGFTDTTTLTVEEDGSSETFFTSRLTWDAGGENALSWSLETPGMLISAEGQLECSADTLDLRLDTLSLAFMGMHVGTLSADLSLTEYTPLLTPAEGIDVAALSQDEAGDLIWDMQMNLISWASEMMVQFPELAEELFGDFQP